MKKRTLTIAVLAMVTALSLVFAACNPAATVKTDPVPEKTPTGLTAVYGDTLADVSLDRFNDDAGTWAWKDALNTSVGNVGTRTFDAVYTPSDTDKYNALTQPVSIAVSKADAAPTAITGLTAVYGDTLADVSLDSFNGDAGTWAWKDALNTSVGSVGSRTFNALYTPEDLANYNAVTVEITITVTKVTPVPQNMPPTTISAYEGDTLADIDIDLSDYDDQNGTWAWELVETTAVGSAGQDKVFKVIYTHNEGTELYNTVEVEITVTVNYSLTVQQFFEDNYITNLTGAESVSYVAAIGTAEYDALRLTGSVVNIALDTDALNQAVVEGYNSICIKIANNGTTTDQRVHIYANKAVNGAASYSSSVLAPATQTLYTVKISLDIVDEWTSATLYLAFADFDIESISFVDLVTADAKDFMAENHILSIKNNVNDTIDIEDISETDDTPVMPLTYGGSENDIQTIIDPVAVNAAAAEGYTRVVVRFVHFGTTAAVPAYFNYNGAIVQGVKNFSPGQSVQEHSFPLSQTTTNIAFVTRFNVKIVSVEFSTLITPEARGFMADNNVTEISGAASAIYETGIGTAGYDAMRVVGNPYLTINAQVVNQAVAEGYKTLKISFSNNGSKSDRIFVYVNKATNQAVTTQSDGVSAAENTLRVVTFNLAELKDKESATTFESLILFFRLENVDIESITFVDLVTPEAQAFMDANYITAINNNTTGELKVEDLSETDDTQVMPLVDGGTDSTAINLVIDAAAVNAAKAAGATQVRVSFVHTGTAAKLALFSWNGNYITTTPNYNANASIQSKTDVMKEGTCTSLIFYARFPLKLVAVEFLDADGNVVIIPSQG